jgi:hypothetical protein
MAIDERARHRLYQRLEEVLGTEEATVLMEHLPPLGWGDVATKQDLAQLEGRLTDRFEARLERALRQQTRTFILTTATFMLTLVGVVLGTR